MLNLLIKFQLKVHLRKGFFPFVAIEQSVGSWKLCDVDKIAFYRRCFCGSH
jgi:hypothetical protein